MTHRIVIVSNGSGSRTRDVLQHSGLTDVVVLNGVTDRSFDRTAHTWTLRTGDGTEHRAQIVVDERPAEHTPVPYLGIAVHGMPNHFLLSGPDHAGKSRYIIECLRTMDSRGSTRIEVRHSTQQVYNDKSGSGREVIPWRRLARKIPSAFHMSSSPTLDDEVFDGPVVVHIGDDAFERRARLAGHLDPIDGRYHWQGTLFGELPEDVVSRTVTVGIDDRRADGRITERTPSGYSVTGVGAPPFPLDDVEVTLPQA
ncbi:DUF4873 domain-containing protein [Mycolicibacterium arseniciresistens]|uniref:DUF4873 domain-containing protein n=1 Tax=Mycolicibacterium arseniciresistens TaxID=3062257 RepID=A0ABT8ULL4_9MYCO|nr:DUF4873 domain-containing protein [Mycolicibacterium arseniciresistens]MDO3638692.1 DUF4873 domain-containing protein [Mycolicibacterium arseniciresistens]